MTTSALCPPASAGDEPKTLEGNHVIIACGGRWVVLAHLQQGSVAVRVNALGPNDLTDYAEALPSACVKKRPARRIEGPGPPVASIVFRVT